MRSNKSEHSTEWADAHSASVLDVLPKMMDKTKEYYAVIFTSAHSGKDNAEYAAMSDRMVELAAQQPGFLGVDSARNNGNGLGITVSYWVDEESIKEWKKHSEHLLAQTLGRKKWYEHFSVRIAKVCREYRFEAKAEPDGAGNEDHHGGF